MNGRKQVGEERIKNAQVQTIVYKSTSSPFTVDLSKLELWVIGFKIRNEGTGVCDVTFNDQAQNSWQLNLRESVEFSNHPNWRRKEKITCALNGAGTTIYSIAVEALDIT